MCIAIPVVYPLLSKNTHKLFQLLALMIDEFREKELEIILKLYSYYIFIIAAISTRIWLVFKQVSKQHCSHMKT